MVYTNVTRSINYEKRLLNKYDEEAKEGISYPIESRTSWKHNGISKS